MTATRMFCCYIDEAGQAELATWGPDVSSTDPAEHLRRHQRVRELGCQEDGEIFELFEGPSYEDYTHACRAHAGAMLNETETTQVYLVQRAEEKVAVPA